jgi:segregation and condensation protein B
MNQKNTEQLASQLESILFVYGEPLSLKRISQFLECSFDDVEEAVGILCSQYNLSCRGLALVRKDDTLLLVTRSENASIVRKFTNRDINTPLSNALLEVMSIVAYRSPVTRQEIEYIRGVNCGSALRNLLIRGLIEKVHHSDDKRAFLYRPASLFFETIGITNITQLPQYEKLSRDPRLVSTEDEEAKI